MLSFERDFVRHPLHYVNLLSLMLLGLWGLFWFDYSPPMQLSIVISMAAAYVTWGIVHHRMHRDLHIKIIFEYLLVAIFAILVYATLLYRA